MGNIIRRFDQTGAPIEFNWRGETVHTSIVGGVCSIIAMLLTIPFGLLMLLSLHKAGFNLIEANLYLDSATNDIPFNVTTVQTIPALKWGTQFDTSYNISQFLTPVFVQSSASEDDVTSYKFIPAIRCYDKITTDSQYQGQNLYSLLSQFQLYNSLVTQSWWFCPEQDEISILNNYEYSSEMQASMQYTALFMSCTDAQEVLPYGRPEDCNTEVPLTDVLPGVMIYSQFVNQYFDPEIYRFNKTMSYTAMDRKTTFLTGDFSDFINYEYEVQQTQVSYWGNPLLEVVDVRSILDFSDSVQFYRQNLIDVQRTTHGETDRQIFYSISMKQAVEINQKLYSANTIQTFLAIIGGYTALVWMLVNFFISDYQAFLGQKKIIKQLYHSNLDKELDAHSHGDNPPTEQEKEEIRKIIENQVPFTFSYPEHRVMKWIKFFTCCCPSKRGANCLAIRMKRYHMFENACELLEKEFDMKTLVENMRVFHMLQTLRFKRYQPKLVKYFRRYNVDDLETARLAEVGDAEDNDVEKILENFNPTEDNIDTLLYYYLTGKGNDLSAFKDWVRPESQNMLPSLQSDHLSTFKEKLEAYKNIQSIIEDDERTDLNGSINMLLGA